LSFARRVLAGPRAPDRRSRAPPGWRLSGPARCISPHFTRAPSCRGPCCSVRAPGGRSPGCFRLTVALAGGSPWFPA
jgi:hypothetical protein